MLFLRPPLWRCAPQRRQCRNAMHSGKGFNCVIFESNLNCIFKSFIGTLGDINATDVGSRFGKHYEYQRLLGCANASMPGALVNLFLQAIGNYRNTVGDHHPLPHGWVAQTKYGSPAKYAALNLLSALLSQCTVRSRYCRHLLAT